ncbi:PaaI family thioesterase [Pelotomaculum propionicicum]|uniref:Acyl-coenzyme A thioesterase PaaI n=1 Tax=Pelotomaculum propionicicum TaxID=258475 RepID=A0A4Y7RMY4_9FIRM|nr:PaaI family thioesterase [Pelotomaculum propionicicum]NLI11521.1 PaaI family thioesterase [Peptococcaceae bacterium]TEB09657.1 Acyl-coenzyme A thioesterase PaaI [Pelotomaculum propionicicum]
MFEVNKQAEFVEKVRSDSFSSLLGIDILEARPGYARASLSIVKDMVNFQGNTHGGAICALIDTTCGAASNSPGQTSAGLSLNVSFLKATQLGATLTAVAEEANRTRRTALYRVNVHDEKNDLVAVASGIAYIKSF